MMVIIRINDMVIIRINDGNNFTDKYSKHLQHSTVNNGPTLTNSNST